MALFICCFVALTDEPQLAPLYVEGEGEGTLSDGNEEEEEGKREKGDSGESKIN